MRKGIFAIFILLIGAMASAQQRYLSPAAKISVLTCGPGEELYSSFGHSAFRVQDASQGIDIVYNYGVFDTRGENFYYRFSQGQMDYLLARQIFFEFLDPYKLENRWVKEQILDLDEAERNELFRFLEKNALPENRVYQYDFFHNNCATKIWEVLKKVNGDALEFNEAYIDTTYSFRELIHHNLKTNSWGSFGIDLALGSVIDRTMSPKEHMYLPMYVSRQIKHARLGNDPLTFAETLLVMPVQTRSNNTILKTPLFWIILLFTVTLWLTYRDFKSVKRSRWFDFLLFLVIGLHGMLIFYLWFLTDHVWTVLNFNILWVFPLNVIVAFLLLKRNPPNWVKKYLLLLLLLLGLTLILWILKVQEFSMLILPFLILLAVRYFYLYHTFTVHKIST